MTVEMTAPPTQQDTYWPPPQGQWTYTDYARLPDNGFRHEVIRGELYVSPALLRQRVLFALSRHFVYYLDKYPTGEVLLAPIDVNLPELANPVQHLCRGRCPRVLDD